METFKTDIKIFRKSEMKSWIRFFILYFLFYLASNWIFHLSNDKFITVAVTLLLLKIVDTLSQYHVKEIKINRQSNTLTFGLRSFWNGEKVKQYDLGKVTSELKYNLNQKKLFFSQYHLNIFLGNKEKFTIGNRYGFSLDKLKLLDNSLKSHDKFVIV